MNELDAFNLTLSARIVLIGRTGIDDVVRRIPGTEVIRARNPIEAIAEVALPIDAQSPSQVIVVVGTDVALLIEDFGNNGDGAAEFLRGLQMVHPSARLYLAVPRRNIDDPVSDGYHDSVPIDATAMECVEAFMAGESAAAGEEHDAFFAGINPPRREPSPIPAAPRTAGPAINGNGNGHAPKAKNSFEEMASYPSSLAAPGGVFVDNFTSVAVPLYDNAPQQKSADARTGADAPPSPPPSSASSGSLNSASDRMLRAMLGGKDIRTEAVEIIRAATGDASVLLTDSNDSLPGVLVEVDGRAVAKLRGRVASEKLAPHAAWLSQWLRMDQQVSELKEWAFTDSLTGAWNRRYFEMFLAESIVEARKLRRSLTILYFDIDDFKRWNDENGHAAGDEILTETVKLLKSVIRPTDKVCRVGGDEFAVIFHEPQGPRDPGSRHPEDLLQVAKRFQEQIRSKRFPKLSVTHTPLGISGGLATYPWDARSAEELIKVADQRSMQCKRAGKNAITFGDESK